MILSKRPSVEDDKRFIYSTWLLSSRQYVKFIPWEARRSAIQALVDSCEFEVVYPDNDVDVILGWVARLAGKVLWVYVQKDARGCGIRRKLETH